MEIPHSVPMAQSRAQQHSGLFMTSVEQRHDENHWKHLCSPSYFSCSPPVTMLIRITTFQAWSAGLFTRWACKNIPCRYVKCFLWWVWLKYWKWTLPFRESGQGSSKEKDHMLLSKLLQQKCWVHNFMGRTKCSNSTTMYAWAIYI